MNLDDMRRQAQGIAAPMGAAPEMPAFASFVAMMRQSEREERRKLTFYTVIMTAVGITLLATAHTQRSTGILLIAVTYAVVAGLSLWKVRQLKQVDYTKPTGTFLSEARTRYRFWGWKETLAAVPGLTLLAVGGGLVVQRMAEKYFGPSGQTAALWGFAAFFLLTVVLGMFFSWRDWKRSKGTVLAEIDRLERELMNG